MNIPTGYTNEARLAFGNGKAERGLEYHSKHRRDVPPERLYNGLGLTHALKTTILCIKVNTLFQAFECHL
ncbi:MAG: hypothetical protein KME54_29065 [Tolypothrix brevis GSE-NOS-MK-07-07A]|nr:hypothetical protein [Tolypothrix brevis GSE-NOS-MK-07-07A]